MSISSHLDELDAAEEELLSARTSDIWGSTVFYPFPTPKNALAGDSAERKGTPLFRGCLAYFPNALAYVSQISKAGNDKHNPGEEMHHARGKSSDHADCIARHLIDHGGIDEEDGLLHSGKLAWRALALLQEELEARGAPLARGAKQCEA